MTDRVYKLKEESVNAKPSLSIERALLETEFYQENYGKFSTPLFRAKNFYNLCDKKKIYLGDDELIVGERGEKPKSVSTFPELNCHTVEDFEVLRSREKQNYYISDEDIQTYKEKVIPYWKGKTQKEKVFKHVPKSWKDLYQAGVFTEFMEQRAPGHTALDGKMYKLGINGFKKKIDTALAKLDFINDPEATFKQDELNAMLVSCDAIIRLGERYAEEAQRQIEEKQFLLSKGASKSIDANQKEKLETRIVELKEIKRICLKIPAQKPDTFREAIQLYWFCHLGTILELNGWDAMNPGHFDQHLAPFYEKEIMKGTLTRDQAKEYVECFFIKINNHPAPPKVGVTAKESGTYNDFTNINIGGVTKTGDAGENEVSYIFLEVLAELHILQPGLSVHIADRTSEHFLKEACKVIRLGYGYPSIFNPDVYIKEMVNMGKSLEDAREGGCSGCIETGAFGKEAYVLTGYLNTPKLLELALNNGVDPLTNEQISIKTGDPLNFKTFEDVYAAFLKQLQYVINEKIKVSNYIDCMFARYTPATFLSVLIDDCISKGKDYYDAGPRYNNNFIQCTGLGTITDSLSAFKKHVFEEKNYTMDQMLKMIATNFDNNTVERQYIIHNTSFFGNDDDYADDLAVRVFNDLYDSIDGIPNIKGGFFRMDMLSTTCHIYFGQMLGASANGRLANISISDGTSPQQGCDTQGPTSVVKSLGKLDQTKCAGTLLNMRFLPSLLKTDTDIEKLAQLVRSYFSLGGHHIQFNIVDTKTLRDAQKHPENYRDLMVRVAGYSDYFNDLSNDFQEEVISRTENEDF
ncbi:MAG: glycyl radical protein [Bacteroidales bacterium]